MSIFDETVFVTGFPGFIAGRLIQRLAADGARLLLLVQPAFVARAHQDIARICGDTKVANDSFSIIEGDITQERLGLSGRDLAAVQTETTTVFHLAAMSIMSCER